MEKQKALIISGQYFPLRVVQYWIMWKTYGRDKAIPWTFSTY